jgi:type I restriction enzyme M protein
MANDVRTAKSLTSVLWEGADILRPKMSANDYKDYLLPLTFFKYLSDKNLDEAHKLLSYEKGVTLAQMQAEYEKAGKDPATWGDLRKELLKERKYCLQPDQTFTHFIGEIRTNTFQREHLGAAFNAVEACGPMYEGLFKSVDLYSTNLGPNEQKQAQTITDLMLKFDELDLLDYDGDAIGDAYEYMLGQFASETGKKAGEFYTPKRVSEILTRIAIMGQEDKRGLLVYDPAMGSGSLLLDARKYSHYRDLVIHFGQEVIPTTFNLARMNMILHGVSPENQHLRNGDTLDADWPTTEESEFDMVVMNPPYSLNWSASDGFKTDPRFSGYGNALPPKSKADYAFLLHGYYHLKGTGTMAIVLPHGVLFRGASEGGIRKSLCEKGAIYAVIGLPGKLFYNTSIPTAIVILKKSRENLDRDILFIDASKEFDKGKKQDSLSEEQVDAILDMYRNRTDVDKHAHLATFEEIEKNEFNLNIPRYVDSSEEEEDIDIGKTVDDLTGIDNEIAKLSGDLYKDMLDLTSEDKGLQNDLKKLADLLKGSN